MPSTATNVTNASRPVEFSDGFGVRRRTADPATPEAVEILRIDQALAGASSFEFMLRERVSRLANFRHAAFARVRRVDRLDGGRTLALVSDVPDGVRLSTLIADGAALGVPLDVNAALQLIRQLVPAIATLHQNARDVSHGTLAPERIVVTSQGKVVVTEHALGAAVEQLAYSRERLWKDLRVAVSSGAGVVRLNHRVDVMQIGIVGLALVLGRTMGDDDLRLLPEIVGDATETSALGARKSISEPLRRWLSRALQLDARSSFESALEAQLALDDVVAADKGYAATPEALEAFLASHQAALTAPPAPAAAPVAAVVPEAAPTPAPSSPAVFAEPLPIIVHEPETPALPPSAGAVLPEFAAVKPEAQAAHAAPAAEATSAAPSFIATALTPVHAPADEASAPPPPAPPSNKSGTRAAAPPSFSDADHSAPPERAVDIGPLATPTAQPKSGSRSSSRPGVPAATSSTSSTTQAEARASADRSGIRPAYVPPVEPPAADAPVFDRTPQFATWNSGVSASWRLAAIVLALVALAEGAVLGWKLSRGLPAMSIGQGSGVVKVDSKPAGVQVSIDGNRKGATPLTLTLPSGTHVMEVSSGGEPRVVPLTVVAGETLGEYIELAGTSAAGRISVGSTPQGATVLLDGQPHGTTPTEIRDVAAGEHELVLELGASRVRQGVKIVAGTTTTISLPLKGGLPAPAPAAASGASPAAGAAQSAQLPSALGIVAFDVPFEMQVAEGSSSLGTTTAQLSLTSGPHDLRLTSDALAFSTTVHVNVGEGKATSVSVPLPKGSIDINATPWAEVWIDGDKMGETPLGNLQVTIGTHQVTFRHPKLGEQRHSVTITTATPARLSVDMNKPAQ